MEIGNPNAGEAKFKRSAELAYPPDVQGDFPVLVHAVNKSGLIFVITKFGYLFVYEAANGYLIYRQRITDSWIFAGVRNPKTDGMIAINRNGQMLAINVDQAALVPYIMNQCKHIPDNVGVAFKLAQRHSLPGADDLFSARFESLFSTGDYKGAAIIARDAPGTTLRNMDTINKFKAVQAASGPQPILIYFSTLLETTKLNEIESVELVKPVLSQGKKNLVEDWIRQDKLTHSSQLGETIKLFDPQLALSVFLRSDNNEAVIQGFVETGQFDKIIPYM